MNPELNETVKRTTIKKYLKILFDFASELRVRREKRKGVGKWRQDVVDYLSGVDGSIDDAIEKYAMVDIPK